MVKVILKRTLVNKIRRNKARTSVRKLVDIINSCDKVNVLAAFLDAESKLQKCVNKGILHKNAAARKISRLNARVKALVTSC